MGFANKSSGEADDDEVVAKAFRAFEKMPGEIDMDSFRSMLMAFGDKFTGDEVTAAYAAFDEFVDEDTMMLDCDSRPFLEGYWRLLHRHHHLVLYFQVNPHCLKASSEHNKDINYNP